MSDFQKIASQYQQAVLRQVVPFWLSHSRDERCGGYFDLLTHTGEVVEGDKTVWIQAQQVWAFSWLYNTLDGQPAWLAHAQHGATFLNQFAHTETLHCYDQLDRLGRAVSPATTLLPDCFMAMAYAQFYRASGQDEWGRLAKQVFGNVLHQHERTRQARTSSESSFRQLKHVSEPITLLKVVQDMQPLLDEETRKEQIDQILYELLFEFVDRRTDVLRESVLPEGTFINTPEGRRLNTGLTFQAANYLFDLYAESLLPNAALPATVNRKLMSMAISWCLRTCEQAWDPTTAGLNSFLDLKGYPSVYPDWQQKWAWVQVEALSALLKGYYYTQHPDCLKWFRRIHDYTFQHFPDLQQAGWHLAIDQYTHPLLPLKSTATVGCFSLIRCLTELAQLLPKCDQVKPLRQATRSSSFQGFTDRS